MEKFSEKLKKIFSSEASLQRIPIYFFLTCVLLVVLICKLGETNHYLKEIAANGTNVIEIETKDEDYENVVDVYIETTKSAEDIVPILDVLTTEETTTKKTKTEATTKNTKTEATTKNTKTEATTKNTESTTNQTQTVQTTVDNKNNSSRTTYVLNINSKKIHLADCSFVNRTKEENKKTVELTDEELQEYLNNGYTFCKTCGGD